jgi:hypothetical protein
MIYPNPFSGEVSISYPKEQLNLQLQMLKEVISLPNDTRTVTMEKTGQKEFSMLKHSDGRVLRL